MLELSLVINLGKISFFNLSEDNNKFFIFKKFITFSSLIFAISSKNSSIISFFNSSLIVFLSLSSVLISFIIFSLLSSILDSFFEFLIIKILGVFFVLFLINFFLYTLFCFNTEDGRVELNKFILWATDKFFK